MKGHENEITAVIVGVTGPIGQAIAARFLDSGCQVVGIARTPIESSSPLEQNPKFFFHSVDVTKAMETRRFFRNTTRKYGRPAYLIYAAGLKPDMDVPLARYSLRNWHRTIETYVSGFLVCFQEAFKVLVPKGHIIAISSAVTRFGSSNLPPLFIGHYSAAKAALNEVCKWARREAHERELLLSRFAPSAVEVPFHQNAPSYRRPPAMVPLLFLAGRIVDAALNHKEFDEEIIATPEGPKIVAALL